MKINFYGAKFKIYIFLTENNKRVSGSYEFYLLLFIKLIFGEFFFANKKDNCLLFFSGKVKFLKLRVEF